MKKQLNIFNAEPAAPIIIVRPHDEPRAHTGAKVAAARQPVKRRADPEQDTYLSNDSWEDEYDEAGAYLDSSEDSPRGARAADRVTIFWDIIGRLNWSLVSDRIVNGAHVAGVLSGLSRDEKNIFAELYKEFYERALAILSADGIFARNGINDDYSMQRIISHVIAMGREQYETLTADLEILDFLVKSNECQSLARYLPRLT